MSAFDFSVIASLILALSLVIAQASLLISLIKKQMFGINTGRLSRLSLSQKAVQISAIFVFAGILLAGCCIVILRIHDLCIKDGITPYFSDVHQIFHSGWITFNSLALLSAVTLAFTRAYAVFENSIYAIKPLTIKIHIAVSIFWSMSGMIFVCLAKLKLYNVIVWDTGFGINALVVIAQLFHLIWVFNYRLFRLALDDQQCNEQSSMDNQNEITMDNSHVNDDKMVQLTDKQKTMLAVVRKHSILGIFIVIFLLLANVNYLLAVQVYLKSKNASDSRIEYPHYLSLGTYLNSTKYMVIFDIILVLTFNLVTFTAYLGFSVNQKYYQYFCHYIDFKCKTFCEWKAKKKLDKNDDILLTMGTINLEQENDEYTATQTDGIKQ